MAIQNSRCDHCRFWLTSKFNNAARLHPDDFSGECHRYAPSPGDGGHWYALMEFVSTFFWSKWDHDRNKWPDWEEWDRDAVWPVTSASDFCGDWDGGKSVESSDSSEKDEQNQR